MPLNSWLHYFTREHVPSIHAESFSRALSRSTAAHRTSFPSPFRTSPNRSRSLRARSTMLVSSFRPTLPPSSNARRVPARAASGSRALSTARQLPTSSGSSAAPRTTRAEYTSLALSCLRCTACAWKRHTRPASECMRACACVCVRARKHASAQARRHGSIHTYSVHNEAHDIVSAGRDALGEPARCLEFVVVATCKNAVVHANRPHREGRNRYQIGQRVVIETETSDRN